MLPDVKSQENAESQPAQDHNGRQCYFRSTLLSCLFPFRPRLSHADMAVDSGFWRDEFWTLSSVLFSVLTAFYLDEPQPERVQLESSSPSNATDVLPASDDDATNPVPEHLTQCPAPH
jgi:hypothetical protein